MLSSSMSKISIIAVVMNRNARIEYAVGTWLASRVDEIVLVDWSSSAPPSLPKNSRLKVLRVDGESEFILTQALNLAADHATGEILIKLDADYCVETDFLDRIPLRDGVFCRGCNKGMDPDENARSLNGLLVVSRESFLSVGGYKEGIVGCGWDDDDLYARLSRAGLSPIKLGEEVGISHLPHPRSLRTANMPNGNYKAMRKRNRELAGGEQWTRNSKRTQWIQKAWKFRRVT